MSLSPVAGGAVFRSFSHRRIPSRGRGGHKQNLLVGVLKLGADSHGFGLFRVVLMFVLPCFVVKEQSERRRDEFMRQKKQWRWEV